MEELIRSGVENSLLQSLLIGLLPAVLVDLRSFLAWKAEEGPAQFNVKVAGWRWLLGAFSGVSVWATASVGLIENRAVQGLVTGALSGVAVDIEKFRALGGFDDLSKFNAKAFATRAAQGAIVGLASAFGFALV